MRQWLSVSVRRLAGPVIQAFVARQRAIRVITRYVARFRASLGARHLVDGLNDRAFDIHLARATDAGNRSRDGNSNGILLHGAARSAPAKDRHRLAVQVQTYAFHGFSRSNM
jgi:hypothetical protein